MIKISRPDIGLGHGRGNQLIVLIRQRLSGKIHLHHCSREFLRGVIHTQKSIRLKIGAVKSAGKTEEFERVKSIEFYAQIKLRQIRRRLSGLDLVSQRKNAPDI